MLRLVSSSHDSRDSNFSLHVENLLSLLMVGKSELTRKTYQADLEAFGRFLDCPAAEPGVGRLLTGGEGYAYKVLLDYTGFLKEKGLQNTSINKKLAPIRSVMTLAKAIGMIEWQARSQYLKTEGGYRDTRGPGEEAVEALKRYLLSNEGPKAARDYAMVCFMYDLAVRRRGVVMLDLADIDFNTGKVWVILKGHSQPKLKTMPESVITALRQWLSFRGEEPGPLFVALDRNKQKDGRISHTAFNKILYKYGQKLGHKYTPHGLRHTAITKAVRLAQKNGWPIPDIRQYSDHSSITTLQKYCDNVRDIQGIIADAVSRAVG